MLLNTKLRGDLCKLPWHQAVLSVCFPTSSTKWHIDIHSDACVTDMIPQGVSSSLPAGSKNPARSCRAVEVLPLCTSIRALLDLLLTCSREGNTCHSKRSKHRISFGRLKDLKQIKEKKKLQWCYSLSSDWETSCLQDATLLAGGTVPVRHCTGPNCFFTLTTADQ